MAEVTVTPLALDAANFAVEYGVVIKPPADRRNLMQILPFTLWPSRFPKKQFNLIMELQPDYNILIDKISQNSELLMNSLQKVIKHDDFVRRMADVYTKVDWKNQLPISITLQRCDYLLQYEYDRQEVRLIPKLVEWNAFAPALLGITKDVAKLHKALQLKYKGSDFEKLYKEQISTPDPVSIACSALALVWKEYGEPEAVILLVNNEIEFNMFDIAKFEPVLAIKHDIKMIMCTLEKLKDTATLGTDGRLFVNGTEVAVVYYRTAYNSKAIYTERQWSAYLLLEQSRAVKCPPVSHQLVTCKKIQQVICNSNVLESLLSDPAMVARIRSTFVGQYSLDMGPEGDKVIELALQNPEKYVLKNQVEGQGFCLCDDALKQKLLEIQDSEERAVYILMDRINCPTQESVIVGVSNHDSNYSFYQTNTEVGVFGVLVRNGERILMNKSADYLVKCLPANREETKMCRIALSSLNLY